MSKRRLKDRTYILTANDLVTGDIVFWSGQGHWSRSILEAQAETEDQQIDALEQIGLDGEAGNLVVGSYLVPMENAGLGRLFPVELREQQRLAGPSIAYQNAAAFDQRIAA